MKTAIKLIVFGFLLLWSIQRRIENVLVRSIQHLRRNRGKCHRVGDYITIIEIITRWVIRIFKEEIFLD